MAQVLIYAAGFLLWPILFGVLAGRLLGVEVGRIRGVEQLQQSFGSIPHPVRALRRRVARGRRYASIILAVRRHGLLSTLSHRNPATTIEHVHERERRLGVQLSQALQEAGGVFVKFGQVLSTRPDLLGERTCEQLSVLQDRVVPADLAAIERLLGTELGRSPQEVVEWFDALRQVAGRAAPGGPAAA